MCVPVDVPACRRGVFRRCKWVFVHWSGEGVGAVKRGGARDLSVAPRARAKQVTRVFDCSMIVEKVSRRNAIGGQNVQYQQHAAFVQYFACHTRMVW